MLQAAGACSWDRWRGRMRACSLSALTTLAVWGIGFLRNSRTEVFRRNTLKKLRLALHSMNTMAALREETGVEFAGAATGSLRTIRPAACRLSRAHSLFSPMKEPPLRFSTELPLVPALALAHCSVCPIEQVTVWGWRRDRASACLEKPGRRTAEEITLFKSVGTAIEDLAAARLILAAAATGG